MQLGTKVGIGVAIGGTLIAGAGIASALRAARDEDAPAAPDAAGRRGVAPTGGTSPGDDPLPYPGGGGTSPGDEPIRMPVRGHVDPPGFWDDFGVDGSLRGDRLDATMDPRGWGNDIELRGRVDHGGWSTEVDPAGWSNTTRLTGRATRGGYEGTVDRPGFWNDVDHRITETIRGVQVLREGRFEESWTPGWDEAVWRSSPNGRHVEGRTLEFDPPGWGNTTRVTLEANVPAGVEATIAAALYDGWKTEQERLADYPDTDPGGTSPGDDGSPTTPSGPTSPGDDYPGSGYPDGGGYPTSPGDEPWAPGYPDAYPIA